MNGLMTVFCAAQETTAAIEIDPIVTAYSDLKIPVLSMVMMGLSAAILLGALILCFVMLFNRTENWGTGLISGMAGYLLICYALYMGIQVALNAIPFTKGFVQNQPDHYTVLITVLSGLLVCLAVFATMKYVSNMMMKRAQMMTIGTALAVGVGMFGASVIISKEMMNSIQYIVVATSINKMGFDPAVTTTVASMMENGYEKEEAIKLATDSLLSMINEPSISFLLNGTYYILMAVLQICAAVLVYGVMKGTLDNKWQILGYSGLLLSIIPSVLSNVTGIPGWVAFLINLTLSGVVLFLTVKAVKTYMPDDFQSLTYNHRKKKVKEDAEKRKKMPHIEMPK